MNVVAKLALFGAAVYIGTRAINGEGPLRHLTKAIVGPDLDDIPGLTGGPSRAELLRERGALVRRARGASAMAALEDDYGDRMGGYGDELDPGLLTPGGGYEDVEVDTGEAADGLTVLDRAIGRALQRRGL